jgi:hypothetical protein
MQGIILPTSTPDQLVPTGAIVKKPLQTLMASHKIPTVANFWIDFEKGNKILLLFLRRTQLHFSQGASEKSHQKDLLKQLNK